MTVQDIIKRYLTDNGYDGLFNTDIDGGCACEIADLAPCQEVGLDCKAGYKEPCNGDGYGCGGDCSFHIVLDKPNQTGGK